MANHPIPKIIVAVDFGTTFSGVAYTYTDTPEDKEVISIWPGGKNGTSDKVPTEICYDRTVANGYRWGFDIKPGQERHQWFKLQLDPSQVRKNNLSSLARKYPSKTELPPGYAGDPTVYVVDYLTALRKQTIETLNRRYSQEFVEKTPIEYVLTIPAVWSDSAKNKTLECAMKAGMTTISCISEPEAAAVYTMNAIQPNILRLNNNFVVCDAGGGTVDLITYKVTRLEPLQVEESVVGDGRLCGSIYLNRRFEEFLERKLGVDVMANVRPKSKALMMETFDGFIKRDFCDLPQQKEYYISAPGIAETAANGIEEGFLIITRAEVRNIFEPVILEVKELVLEQIRNVRKEKGHVAAILLVGGFGSNEYLLRCLKQCVDIEIMQPQNAWTAVVRGALLRGLEGSLITHRQARRHYGIKFWSSFREGIDPEYNKSWDDFEGVWICNNRMKWYVNKGERVADTKAVSLPWLRYSSLSSDFKSELIDIYCCTSNDAPEYFNSQISFICRLRADLSSIPKSKFIRRPSATLGHPDKYIVKFNIDMSMDSASMRFKLVIDGVPYGSVSTEFL